VDVACFNLPEPEEAFPLLVSTTKICQAGFHVCHDTEETLCHWLDALVRRGVPPPPGS